MRIWYSDIFEFPLPKRSRFPAAKYRKVRERLEVVGGAHINSAFRIAPAADDPALLRVHDDGYLGGLKAGTLSDRAMRRIGFPWSEALVKRARHSAGGTLAACRDALAGGVSINLGGGTHHAFRDFGSGYCIFNDSAVAVRSLQREGFEGNVLVLDCDVHQGDGTASLLREDPKVFTFSIHGKNNFPLRKVQGDLDIELENDTRDPDYLSALASGIDRVLNRFVPDLVIFIAGADPYRKDRFGRLALTKKGLHQRDQLVFRCFRDQKIPMAVTLGGGYPGDIGDIVEIHAATVLLAAHYK